MLKNKNKQVASIRKKNKTYLFHLFLRKTVISQYFILLALSLSIINCQTEIVTEEIKEIKEIKSRQELEQDRINQNLLAEMQLGRNMAGRLLQFYGVYGNQNLVRYINQVGTYVAQFSPKLNYHFMFNILDTQEVNAFACPGGYILLTKGLINELGSEAELAAVLGHEIAHINKKHMFDTLQKMSPKKKEEEAKKLDAEKKRSQSKIDSSRKRTKSKKSAAASTLARYLTGTGLNIGFDLLKTATVGMNVILNQGLSPKLEYEADKLGLLYASNAGYDPLAYNRFLNRLAKKRKENTNFSSLFSLGKTHPDPVDRIKSLNKEIENLNLKSSPGAVGKDRFLEKKKDL